MAQLSAAEQEIERLDHTVRDLVNRDQEMRAELRNREDSVSHLTQQCEALARERDDAARFGSSVARDFENSRALTVNMEHSQEELARRNAQLEADNLHMSRVMAQLEQDREVALRDNEALRERNAQIEGALSDERIQSQYKSMELEKVKSEAGESQYSDRSFDEREQQHLQNVISSLKQTIEKKDQAHTEERERLEDENQKLSSYIETYERRLQDFETKKDE